MILLIEIEKPMEILLNSIMRDRKLLIGPKTSGFSDTRITCQNLEDAAGNHFFDDRPNKYGLSEIESHKIRAYFQEGCADYNFVIELHKRFSGIMEKETGEFMEMVNNRRKRIGLEPLYS